MTLDYQQDTRPPFFNRKIVVIFMVFICLLLTIPAVNTWNGRYDAGYRAGAGEGAAYKELYSKLEKENKSLQKQHESDSKETTRLNRIVAELETRKGPFSPKIREAEIIEKNQELNQKLADVDRIRSEEARQSREVGEKLGKAQRDEERVSELSKNLQNRNYELVLSRIANIVFGLATCILLGYLFLKAYGIIPPNNDPTPFVGKQKISISSSDNPDNVKVLKSKEDIDDTKALMSHE